MNFFRRKEKRERAHTDFEIIIDTYERQLIVYASRITGSRSTAEDIAQEAFIKLSQYWRGELTPGPAVSAWLYKAAHNIAIDHIRHEKTRAEAHKKHYEEREIERGAAKSDDSQNDDDAAKIRAALAALPERERALVVLKVYENKSYGEIGQITGLKTGNVGYILHNAMKKLAQIMSNKKGGDGK